MKENVTLIKHIVPNAPDRREIARYARADLNDAATEKMVDDCIGAIAYLAEYAAVYRILPLKIDGDTVDMQFSTVRSEKLAKHLKDCTRVILFAVTAGLSFDAYINKYSRISPLSAHIASSFGTERVEAVADGFCRDISAELADEGFTVTSRFSPGYGDLDLLLQRDIFACLTPEKYIGLCLNASLMMSPSKSVTAIIGVKKNELS